jgi:hypothetical protein
LPACRRSANGWNGVTLPSSFGGQGLPDVLGVAVKEMWNSANMSFALCPLLTAGAVEALLTCASDELKAIYLEKMITGEWTGTMNLTEPQAGSDLALIRTAPSRRATALPHLRPEDLHHLRRARHDGQHRPLVLARTARRARPASRASRCSWCPSSW